MLHDSLNITARGVFANNFLGHTPSRKTRTGFSQGKAQKTSDKITGVVHQKTPRTQVPGKTIAISQNLAR